MEVVLRPANDVFLAQVVFPAFEVGVRSAAPALEDLHGHLDDDETKVALELLLEQGEPTLFGLDTLHWHRVVGALLFHGWRRTPRGWAKGEPTFGYAGDFSETLHLALMLEAPDYPYFDVEKSRAYRETFFERTPQRDGLAAMLCGLWLPVPPFPPDQVLTVVGRGEYQPSTGLARADWSHRSLQVVNQWAARLPAALSRLLAREEQRLKPVEVPEKHEVLQYWLGRQLNPPPLPVTFSGLGPKGTVWLRELGTLARLLRETAASAQGLTSVLSLVTDGH